MTDVPTLVAQARAAREAGQHADSLALFRAAASLQPQHLGLRMEAASDLVQLGRPAEAEAEYRAVLSVDPRHAGALISLGHAARKRGDRQAALSCFSQACDADPAHIWARMEAAVELREAGRVAEAEAAYEAVLAGAPGQSVALLGLAACARQRGDTEAALGFHLRILQGEPEHVWARLQMAADLRDLSRFREAQREYHAILARDPASDAAFLGLGQCARRQQNRAAALAWHQLAADANPQNAWCRLECAVDLREAGELQAARAILSGMLAERQHLLPVLQALAQLERLAGDRPRARSYLRQAVEADPANPAAALELAAEHREAGELDEARHLASTVLQRLAGHVPAFISLGQTEQAGGRHEAALAAFTRAHEGQPQRADLLAHMALAERALGRQARCDALLAQALAAEPGNTAILVHQAEQARMANDIERMRTIYADGLSRDPRHLGLNLGFAESLVLLGRHEDALVHLDRAEAALGSNTLFGVRRVSLLRRIGHWHRALAAARALTQAAPGDFAAWMERLACECCLGSEQDIDACLATAPANTRSEQARLARMRARVFEDRGQWTEAAADYQTSIKLDPEHAEGHFMRTRFCLSTLDLEGARTGLRAFMQANAVTFRLRGQSRHASQTHFGQVLDEYALDEVAVAALQQAQALPSAQRVEAILRITAAHPHSTASAIALLHALRAAGDLASAPRRGVAQAIPAEIVQFWDTSDIPPDVGSTMQSWPAMNPCHSYTVYNDVAAYNFLTTTYGRLAGHLYSRLTSPAQKSDVFRLGYLAARGGVYADSDDRCHAELAAILPPHAHLVLYQEDFGSVGNNFIASVPGHPVMRLAFRLVMASIARGDGETVWLSTGPALLTRAMAQVIAVLEAVCRDQLKTIMVLLRRELFSAVAIHCLTGYKATDRHWSNPSSRTPRPAVVAGQACPAI